MVNEHTPTAAMLMRRDRGVRTCSLFMLALIYFMKVLRLTIWMHLVRVRKSRTAGLLMSMGRSDILADSRRRGRRKRRIWGRHNQRTARQDASNLRYDARRIYRSSAYGFFLYRSS